MANIQNQITSFIASESKEIITSKLEIKKIINRAKRNISTKIAIKIAERSIYKLEQKLANQCKKYETKLYIIDESYTSLSCSLSFIR